MYDKIKILLEFIDREISKPLDNYNEFTREWSKGYRKAMIKIKNLICEIFNQIFNQ